MRFGATEVYLEKSYFSDPHSFIYSLTYLLTLIHLRSRQSDPFKTDQFTLIQSNSHFAIL